MMVGLRNVSDDLTILADLQNCIKEEFKIHNEESIKTAIKMNLRGDFGEVIEAYGQFNRIYLTKIMVGYEKKLLRDHKRALEIRNKMQQHVELTEEEKEDLLKKSIVDVFAEYKTQGKTESIELISYAIYDYLYKRKILDLTPDEKHGLMNRAKVYVVTHVDNKLSLSKLMDNEKTANDVKTIAKRIAVMDYFNKIEKLEL